MLLLRRRTRRCDDSTPSEIGWMDWVSLVWTVAMWESVDFDINVIKRAVERWIRVIFLSGDARILCLKEEMKMV